MLKRPPKARKCAYRKCGKRFQPTRHWQRFHSKDCQWSEWYRLNPKRSAK